MPRSASSDALNPPPASRRGNVRRNVLRAAQVYSVDGSSVDNQMISDDGDTVMANFG
jgi:hypothetical protein